MHNETKRLRRAATVVISVVVMVMGSAGTASAQTDKQIARSAALKQRDLGAAWTATKHTEESPSDLPSCAGTNRANKAAKKYQYRTPDFEHGDQKITNVVFVFPTAKGAKSYLAAYQDPSALECIQRGLDEAIKSEPGATVDVGGLDVTGGPADDGVGYRADLRAAGPDGAPATLVFEAVAFRVGRGVTAITTQNPDVAFPNTPDLATTSIKRLRKGLA